MKPRLPVAERKARETTQHGTRTMYDYHKCRCEECVESNRQYKTAYRKTKKQKSYYKAHPRSTQPRVSSRAIPDGSRGADWTKQDYAPLPASITLPEHTPVHPAFTTECPGCGTHVTSSIPACWFCGESLPVSEHPVLPDTLDGRLPYGARIPQRK